MRTSFTAFALVCAVSSFAFAGEGYYAHQKDRKWHTIKRVSITRDSAFALTSAEPPKVFTAEQVPAPGGGTGLVTVGNIVRVLELAWQFMKANEPVIKFDFPPYTAALPKGTQGQEITPDMLANWQPPRSEVFWLKAKNAYGVEVIKIQYAIQYAYGGTYNGRGQYLANVTMTAPEAPGNFGFSVDLKARVLAGLNFGSSAEPKAGIQMILSYDIKPLLPVRMVHGERSYVVSGDGNLWEVPKTFYKKAANAQALALASR